MAFIIFLFGCIIGSFLNVCIYRIPENKSIAFPGSHCPKCSTPLKWYDLIPVLSFVFLKGRCRYCGERISPRYPAVELLNGLIYLFLYYSFGLGIDYFYYSIIISILMVIFFIDMDHQIIPNKLILIVFLLDIAYKIIRYFLLNESINILNYLSGLAIGAILFILIFIFSKGGIGGGDIKLIGVLGFILGMPLIFLNMFLSFVLGGIISIFLLIIKIKSRKDPIAFGPFLVIGFLISLFWGYEIVYWYLHQILG